MVARFVVGFRMRNGGLILGALSAPAREVDLWVVLGAGLLVGQWAAVVPLPALAGAALCVVLARRRLTLLGGCAFVLALAVAGLRAHRAIARFDEARISALEQIGHPDRCEGVVRVRQSPTLLHRRLAAGFQSGAAEEAELSWEAEWAPVVCGDRFVTSVAIVRLYGGPPDLIRGDRVAVVADLSPVELSRNEGLADARARRARAGVVLSGRVQTAEHLSRGRSLGAVIDRARAHVRGRIDATFAPRAAPLARALVLGETDLDEADDEAFRTSGLAHLLAVSGTHLVLAVVTLVGVMGALLRRIRPLAARFDVGRWAAGAGVAMAWLYQDFAGGSGSAWRAAAMLSAALGARALGRKPDGTRALGLSLVGGGLGDVLAAFDASFTLSVAATAGMMVLRVPLVGAFDLGGARCAGWLARLSRVCADVFATTLSASLGCAPCIAALAPSLPIGGLFANVLAVPIGELAALPLCLGHTLLSPWPVIERGAAVVASGSLLALRALAHATTEASWLSVAVPTPTAWQLAILAVAVVGLWNTLGRKRWEVALVSMAALATVEVAHARACAPRGRLRITFLDVGQGDSTVVDLPDGSAMLIDAGGALGSGSNPGQAVVAPLLRWRRRDRLDVVVLSHPHPDHVGGLPAALSRVEVGELWDNGQGREEGATPAYDSLRAAMHRRGVPVRGPEDLCGRGHSVGAASVQVLAPCPRFTPFADANDNSMVVRIAYGRRAAMLAGDAPMSVESDLVVKYGNALRSDVLKVGHHGSKTSTSEGWIEAVRPSLAIISSGVRNRFGHPFAGTLQRLAGRSLVGRTDRNGSIGWETDGDAVWVTSAAESVTSARGR